MKKFLTKPSTLYAALINFDKRNQLTKKLDLADKYDKKQLFKHILAFWLGSNTTLMRLKMSIIFERICDDNYHYNFYYSLITFDKYISFLKRKKSSSYTVLTECRFALLNFFNENFNMLILDRKKLFLSFSELINEYLNEKTITELKDGYFIQQAKEKILADLHHAKDPPQAIGPIQDNISDDIRTKINIKVISEITNTKSYFFYRDNSFLDNNYLVNKILIETDDHIIIDGLHIKKIKTPSKLIILAIEGSACSEVLSIFNYCTKLYETFGADIVFINHRNFSLRSAALAKSFNDIALDILSVAKYYKKMGHDIALYGHCGGAGLMLQAVEHLKNSNIKFKIVIDRFPTRYIDFLNAENRMEEFGLNNFHYLYLLFLLLKPMRLVQKNLVGIIFYICKLNINFCDIVRSIPRNKILILEPKLPKSKKNKVSFFADALIPAKFNIRESIKDRRHQNRLLFKYLIIQSFNISLCYPEMKKIFNQFAFCFYNCIKLIDDEKLVYFKRGVHDVHAIEVFNFTTRHNIPIHQFISGFFKKNTKRENLLDKLIFISSNEIETIFLEQNCQALNIGKLAKKIASFINVLIENKKYLIDMTNRLDATNLGDINIPLKQLLNSYLFQKLSENNPYNTNISFLNNLTAGRIIFN